jgi:hypothetical protein
MAKKPYYTITIFFFTIILNLIFTGNSFSTELSKDSKISILTIGPGKQLYNSFGHSVIRVQDKTNKIDYTFNYGTFDFNTPNFYLKFIRGKLMYSLSVSYYDMLKAFYINENRSIFEQDLVLTLPQKQAIYRFLENNYLPENQYYKYDFFFDNCATRIRDVFEKVLKDEFKISNIADNTGLSFRELITFFLTNKQWGDLGIDLALGSSIDKKTSYYEAMYLPDYLKRGFGNALIKINDKFIPIVTREKLIYQAPGDEWHTSYLMLINDKHDSLIDFELPQKFNIFSPVLVFWFLFLLIGFITFKNFRKKTISYKIDFVLFSITGLTGILLFLLWVATDHAGTENNFNLLWAIPFNLPFAFLMLSKKKYPLVNYYALFTGIMAVLTLISWEILPQELNISLVPVLMIIALRSFYIYSMEKINT